MKHSVLSFSALAALASFSLGAHAEEMGRVISSTPVIQQVAVPRQVCSNQPVAVQQPKSGAGAVMGAVAGGAMGNAIGNGSGRAAATVLGLIGGAMLGDHVEGSGAASVQNVQQCTTQTVYENRTTAYNVVYEYAGKQYSVQMPHDPGQYVRLQITPVGSAAPAPQADVPVAQAPATYVQPTYLQPTIIESGVVTVPSTVVVPSGYYRPYYPPVGVSLNFGYSNGYYRSHHHGGHWR